MLEKEERIGVVNGKEDTVQVPIISSATSTVLKNLFMVLDFLFRDNCRSETAHGPQSTVLAAGEDSVVSLLLSVDLQVC